MPSSPLPPAPTAHSLPQPRLTNPNPLPITTIQHFPSLIADTASIPLWGKAIPTTHTRDPRLQPSLMSKTGYTATHYTSGTHNDNSYMKDFKDTQPTKPKTMNNLAQKKWANLHYLHKHIIQPAYRSGSIENALWGLR